MFLNYPGFNATFTNLESSGRNGPTLVDNPYKGQDHDCQVTLSSGIQQWTVPYTGQYRIEAVGAAGGYSKNHSDIQYGGRGARMAGTFNLSKDELIQILVGQEGGIRNNGRSSGGGGGTFVVRGSNTSLIVAGGGGGLRAVTKRQQGCDASTNTSGNSGHKSWTGGSNGHGAMGGDNKPSGEGKNENDFIYFTRVSCRRDTFDLQAVDSSALNIYLKPPRCWVKSFFSSAVQLLRSVEIHFSNFGSCRKFGRQQQQKTSILFVIER